MSEAISNRKKETTQVPVGSRFAIEPSINRAPRTRPAIDERQISFADQLIECAVRFGEEIVQLDLRIGRNTCETVTNPARGGVMALSEADGENQNFFHVEIVDPFDCAQDKPGAAESGRKFNGYLDVTK